MLLPTFKLGKSSTKQCAYKILTAFKLCPTEKKLRLAGSTSKYARANGTCSQSDTSKIVP